MVDPWAIIQRYLDQGYTITLRQLANGRHVVTRKGKDVNTDIEGRRPLLIDAIVDLKREVERRNNSMSLTRQIPPGPASLCL